MNPTHVKRCVEKVLALNGHNWTVHDVSPNGMGFDLQLHAIKVTMQEISRLSTIMKTKRINFMGKNVECGYGCDSGCTDSETLVEIEVWDAIIPLDIVPEEETKKARPKRLKLSEFVPEPVIEPKTDPGHYLIVANIVDAKEWCKQRNVTPGQAIFVEDLSLESTIGLGTAWKIVVIGYRRTAPDTKELVDALLAKGYSLLKE